MIHPSKKLLRRREDSPTNKFPDGNFSQAAPRGVRLPPKAETHASLRSSNPLASQAVGSLLFCQIRRREDSNPRGSSPNGFRDRRFQPLSHTSIFLKTNLCPKVRGRDCPFSRLLRDFTYGSATFTPPISEDFAHLSIILTH